MTATLDRPTPSPPAPPGAASRLRRVAVWLRRWYRLLLPIAVSVTLLAVTLVAHVLQSVSTSDRDYLDPDSTAANGGSILAGRLRAAGVTVTRETTSTALVAAAAGGGVTVFVPAPDFLRDADLFALTGLPGSDIVVFVAPGQDQVDALVLDANGLDEDLTYPAVASRWATHVEPPGCTRPEALAAGPAGIDHTEYSDSDYTTYSCYNGGLVGLRSPGPTLVLAGASDPFRNDRIGEVGNATLATALLRSQPTVLWLDVHRLQKLVVTGTKAPNVDATNPTATVTATDTETGTAPSPGGPQSSIYDLFPAWLWMLLGLLALAGVALAAARARRLGPPVAEPIPVAAYGRETIEGRARLYRRARQPTAALAILRRTALLAVPGLVGLPPDTPTAQLVDAVARRIGTPDEEVSALLVDDLELKTHQDLVDATERLDAVMAALAVRPAPALRSAVPAGPTLPPPQPEQPHTPEGEPE